MLINNSNKIFQLTCFIMMLLLINVYGMNTKSKTLQIAGGKIIVEFDNNMKSRVISAIDEKIILGNFAYSEYIIVNGKEIKDFKFFGFTSNDWQDSIGKGKEFIITGLAKNLKKTISIISYDNIPTMLFYKVIYQNTGKGNLIIDGWTNNKYSIIKNKNDDPSFWSYQPGSYGWDNDWIIPLSEGYSRDNYLGMNSVDYGGGTPVADIWRSDYGIAVGHVENVPKLVSFPIVMANKTEASLSIDYKKKIELIPDQEISTFRTFVCVHKGDHFNSLSLYRQFMENQGFQFKDAPEDAYKTEWCGWGYEANFTMEQYQNTYPKVKELGLEWIVLDMGWYKAIGDFYLPKDKFSNHEKDIRKIVKDIHNYDVKAQLWWMPLAVAPNSDLMANHSDYLLINEDGSPRFMPSFFKSFFLCPAYKDVQEYSRQLVIRFMNEGWDGLKIDGNNLNFIPSCYNPAHNHAYPEESVEALPAFYKMVYETALSINPNAVIEICPCGTNQSFFIQPFMNRCVASDPHNSWTLRFKGKTLKALTGSKSVFYGDHVELSDDKSDFASTIGVGGVIGTKFVYPPGIYMNSETGDIGLTPKKELEWKKWIQIYKDNMLTKGIYRGELYDMGYDRPEAHVVQKDNSMYYAFFAKDYDGEVELRGLENKKYKIIDYENNQILGELLESINKLKVKFNKHLLIKAEPI